MAIEQKFICDNCRKEEMQKNVIDWFYIEIPTGTKCRFSNKMMLYGLYCSTACIKESIEKSERPIEQPNTFVTEMVIESNHK